MANTYRYIGKALPKRDAVDIVTGTTSSLTMTKRSNSPISSTGKYSAALTPTRSSKGSTVTRLKIEGR